MQSKSTTLNKLQLERNDGNYRTKVVKPVPEKKVPTIKTEDSDSDSFDPVNDDKKKYLKIFMKSFLGISFPTMRSIVSNQIYNLKNQLYPNRFTI
jgi:hypothetical protein